MKRHMILACLLMLSMNSHAGEWGNFDLLGEAAPTEDSGGGAEADIFKGKLLLGYLASSGNTESKTFNGNLTLNWELPVWRHEFIASGTSNRTEGVLVGESYTASYQADRKFDEQNYLFFAGKYQTDRFSGYDRKLSATLGYGRRLLETDAHTLDLEIGAGARESDLVDGTEEDETITRLGGRYAWQIADASNFTQTILVESGDSNTYSESVSTLTSQLVGELDLVVSYTIKRNSDVPVGLEKTDTYTTVSVQYSF